MSFDRTFLCVPAPYFFVCLFDHAAEVSLIHWFLQVTDCAQLSAFFLFGPGAPAGEQDNLDTRLCLFYFSQHLQSVNPGHHQIEDGLDGQFGGYLQYCCPGRQYYTVEFISFFQRTESVNAMTPENFLELVRKRQSVRGYHPDPVEKDKLERCLEAARLAPSACNAQPWTFIVVSDAGIKNQLADLTSDRWLPLNHWTKQAPVHVVIVVEQANLTSRLGARLKKRDFSWMDVGIAAEHFCLQAVSEGLGTCMLGWFKEEKVRALLHIPANRRVGLIITLGYPADVSIRPKIRKAIPDMVRWNRYG